MPYDLLIYEGAAAHYRHRRPPYSPDLESVLARELELDGRGRLLDVGRGPGILTVRLAPLFEEAVGLDPDAAMLAGGPAGRVSWVVRAESRPADGRFWDWPGDTEIILARKEA